MSELPPDRLALVLAKLVADTSAILPDKLGVYAGVPLADVPSVSAAVNASLYRYRALAKEAIEDGAACVDLRRDAGEASEDFVVWKEVEFSDVMLAEAEGELRRQDEEKAALSRAGPAHSHSAQQFWKEKYESQSYRFWNNFYVRNETRFFKDRHYLDRDFPAIVSIMAKAVGRPVVMLECGCGVGNALFPLVAKYPCLRVTAVDLSARAVELIKEHELYGTGQVSAFVRDAVKDPLVDTVTGVDFAVMLFMASALSPHQFASAFANVASVLKPGGLVLFRDYGSNDAAQLRFKGKHKLGERLYVRQDGTRAYFFTLEDLHRVAAEAGLAVVEARYICRSYYNRQVGEGAPRVWVHAVFQKPIS